MCVWFHLCVEASDYVIDPAKLPLQIQIPLLFSIFVPVAVLAAALFYQKLSGKLDAVVKRYRKRSKLTASHHASDLAPTLNTPAHTNANGEGPLEGSSSAASSPTATVKVLEMSTLGVVPLSVQPLSETATTTLPSAAQAPQTDTSSAAPAQASASTATSIAAAPAVHVQLDTGTAQQTTTAPATTS